MSRTVYLVRNAQVLAALSDDEYSDGKLRCRRDLVRLAPDYADEPVRDWRADALHVFSDYVVGAGLDGDFEYNGSSSYHRGERDGSWVVAVYESSIPDFAGDQFTALVENPETVFHGYVEFVDQGTRYSNAVVELADLAAVCPASKIDKLRVAAGDVFDESRDYNEPTSDIVDALSNSDWEYVGCELVHCGWKEAA